MQTLRQIEGSMRIVVPVHELNADQPRVIGHAIFRSRRGRPQYRGRRNKFSETVPSDYFPTAKAAEDAIRQAKRKR